MAEYDYEGVGYEPNLDGIHEDVASSEMADKNIIGCTWYMETSTLHIVWQDELTSGDKTILDGIVENNT